MYNNIEVVICEQAMTHHFRKRYFVLDLLRGSVVLLMILAHAVYFFHNSTNDLLLGVEKIGNTVCFTVFLLVSGAVSYIAYIKHEEYIIGSRKKLLKRLLAIIGSYYLLALFISSSQILASQAFDRWKLILDILTFRALPSYTEFIPPFIFYSFIIFIFPKFLKQVSNSLPISIIISIYLYFTGFFLYGITVPEFFEPWKAFLAGNEGYFRFPILQYAPIFILGMSWGHWLRTTEKLHHKKEISKFLAIVSAIGILIALIAANIDFKPFDILFLRWPPSIPFLLIGTAFAFMLSYIFYLLKQLKRLPSTRDTLLVFGQNAFALFWIHIFLLKLYEISGGAKTDSIIIFAFLFLVLIIFSIALAIILPFNLRFSLNVHKGLHDEQEIKETETVYRLEEEIYEDVKKEVSFLKRLFSSNKNELKQDSIIKKRHIIVASLLITVLSFSALTSVAKEIKKAVNKQIVKSESSWWSDEYEYNARLSIKNLESLSGIPKNQILKITLDHQSMVNQDKALPNGNDIKIVYWDGKKYQTLEYWLDNKWNLNNTTLKFRNPETISASQELNKIFIYYGNLAAVKQTAENKSPEPWKYKYQSSVIEEKSYPLLAKVERKWSLISDNPIADNKLKLSISGSDNMKNPKAKYKIINSNIEAEMEAIDDNYWEGIISINNLLPGTHQAQVTISDGNKEYKSQKCGFYVSYPLYVTWNFDWEGYDASNSYLDSINNISKKYNIPLTHMFNPRIYTTPTIPANRQQYMTDWVKNRSEKNGDEIGLHLHMFYDFIQDAGLNPKHASNWPNWGDIYKDGYSVLTTNFTEEEIIQLITRAQWWFEQKELGKPISFRAGGWFANLDTLKALEKTGIKIDSSGRTAYDFGYNGYTKQIGPWKLSPTTQPYKPSIGNQNASSTNNLQIWEVPNNGADSYWFQSKDMIDRFNNNYQGGTLNARKQVTFLSHPHWFNKKEQEKINNLFNYLDGFKYEKDSGPVIYVTLKDIYKDWLSKD